MSEPKIDVNAYGYHHKPAPAAAEFRRGATDLAGINEATKAALDLSRDLSDKK